ncbi:MAG: NUDIX domain-containing protein [Nitrososphaerota archaeon]|nr:NUDIX domain-containing protein [Candidatus Calditenuaceae archaeon]MDW8072637.1 NUDIX domain-containing protein [Nitrososphaerota archaeon]
MKLRRSAGAVIFNNSIGENYYLVLLYGGGHWDFPKGGIEEGESEVETALREIKEETNLRDVRIVEGFKRVISYTYKSDETVYKTVIFFLGHTNEFQVILSKEHKAYAWLKYKDALSQLTFRTAKQVLMDADVFLKSHPVFGVNKPQIGNMS